MDELLRMLERHSSTVQLRRLGLTDEHLAGIKFGRKYRDRPLSEHICGDCIHGLTMVVRLKQMTIRHLQIAVTGFDPARNGKVPQCLPIKPGGRIWSSASDLRGASQRRNRRAAGTSVEQADLTPAAENFRIHLGEN